jgi:predicted CoA-binding protein
MNTNDLDIKNILLHHKKICVVGLSPNVTKPSHQIPLYLKKNNYEIVGVYPGETQIAEFKIYSSLAEVPSEFRKFINVFQRSEKIPALVDEIIKLGGCEVLWLQLGIENQIAESKAQDAGIKVVSNRCALIEHKKYN